ncbi:MAG: hypothetical protein U0871_14875 [Gemmataceae bacterium]
MDQTLTSFRSLSNAAPGEGVAERQRRAARELPEVVEQSALNWWEKDAPLPDDDSFLLIGVAVWSGYDLNTLDHVEAAVRAGTAPGLQVYVFDADTMLSQDEVEAVFPGLGSIHHTPIVGLWRGGKLVERECGYLGRQVIARALNIDDKPLHERITATVSST